VSSEPTNEKRWFEFLSLSLLLGLGTAIAALIFFGWLADEVLEGDSRRFDEVTRAAIHQLASPTLTIVMRGFSFVGSTIALTIGTIIVVVRFARRNLGREAKLFAITMIGAGLLNITLNHAFKRARPEPFINLTLTETYSFPTAH
jgi:undecaprenyl-diphosphatase